MHDCLRSQEILSLICESLSGDQGTLVSLALSCSTTLETALNALWKHQHSLVPLLKCFPPDSWAVQGRDTLCFIKPLSSNDWSRVNYYAAKIYSLSFRHPTFVDISISRVVWQVLAVSKPEASHYILPSLQQLDLAEANMSLVSLEHIRLLLGPKITQFRLIMTGSEILRVSLLGALKHLCPLLTDIDIASASTLLGKTSQRVSDLISEWSHLRRLAIGLVTTQAFSSVTNMPLLESLRLYEGCPRNASLVAYVGDGTFPALREFISAKSDMNEVAALLQTMHSPSLRRVLLESDDWYPSSTWASVLKGICRAGRNITTLSIQEFKAPVEDDDKFPIGHDVLILSKDLWSLTTLQLNPAGGFNIDDRTLRIVSTTWPWLESLDLGAHTQWIRPSRITLKGLVPLLKQCPRLTSLGIVVDTTGPDFSLGTRPGKGVTNRNITSLAVGVSKVKDLVNVAVFLSDILPNVTTIQTWGKDQTAFQELWDQVALNIKVFKTIRGWGPAAI